METRTCKVCGKAIPKGRMDALPGVETCKLHSDAVAITDQGAGVVDSADAEDMARCAQSTTRQDRWA